MKKPLIWIVVFICTGLLAQGGPGSAKTVKLAWDANTETDLAGYSVYWGVVSSGITNSTTTVTNTFALNNLANGQYWFGVTARNTNNLESGFSNIVFASIPRNPNNLRILP